MADCEGVFAPWESSSNISTMQHPAGCQGDLEPPPPRAAKRDISKYETMWNRAAAATPNPRQPRITGTAHRVWLPNPVHSKPSEVLREHVGWMWKSVCVGGSIGGVKCVFQKNYNLLANIITLRHYRSHAGPCCRPAVVVSKANHSSPAKALLINTPQTLTNNIHIYIYSGNGFLM